MYSLLIKNAQILDGETDRPQAGDVAVEGQKIVNVSPRINSNAAKVVDAGGKILSPGFIDLQNHSDVYWQIFDNPTLDSMICQGYTTLLVGNCGASLAPLLSSQSLLAAQKWRALEASNINWQSFAEYLDVLEKQPAACNLASLVGYATLRRGIVGDQVRALDPKELSAAQRILEESLEAGAFGLSSGLSYSHEIIISELELFRMAEILKKSSALLSVHLRSEGEGLMESVEEVYDIVANTGVNAKISHLKARGRQNWFRLKEALSRIETAVHRGMNLHFDVYPYDTVWQVLYSYLPKWAMEGGRETMLRNLANPVQRNKILSYLNNSEISFPSLMIGSTANKLGFSGKTLGQVAKNMETSSEQALLHLVEQGGSEVMVFENSLDADQVEELIWHPLSFLATDGAGFAAADHTKLVHPRCFGSAPKFLRQAADLGRLAEAVKKLSSRPAEKLGLKDRGKIKTGYFADLVLFDQETVADRASYQNPYLFPSGIDKVFVNGQEVFSQGKVTGNRPGSVIKKN